MEILFVATELSPFVKVGGLADVVHALSKSLRQLGHKVTIVLPRYAAFETSGLLLARRLTPLPISFAGQSVDVVVHDGRTATGVELVLLDAPGLFDRAGVYGENGADYPDAARRFGIFARAAAELVRQRHQSGTSVGVVHLHDWPAAPVAAYLQAMATAGQIPAIPTVLPGHNLAHQGNFAASELGGPEPVLENTASVGDGRVSFLRAGLVTASRITTVSTNYAAEIQTPAKGAGLSDLLASRAGDLAGITNGIDYATWNPASDSAIAARYDAENAADKGRCKTALLRRLGLDLKLGEGQPRAVVAFVGRMVHQKGADLLAEAMPRIARTGAAIVVAGEGDPTLVAQVRAAAEALPGDAAYLGGASENDVHQLFAAADVVAVPSRFEPCGLVQLYAQRYGALPVAHATGGLVDTVVDCDAQLETGTGFLFDEPTADALVGGVQRALAAYVSPKWPALRRRVMRLDVGWDRPARRYAQIYRAISASA